MAPYKLLLLFLAAYSIAADPTSLRRLDGSRLPLSEANRIAQTELDRAKVTGAQIVILDRGQVVWRYAHGLRRVEGNLPMQTNTNTWAASITKGVFSVYAMQLVERGVISLDTPLASQLSQPLTSYPAYKDSATAIVNDPNWPKVTPRHLLSHTSSLHNFAFLEPDQKLHLHSTPGSIYRYSG
jgi:CubicO group peptidase (beta-lactamase class C family)